MAVIIFPPAAYSSEGSGQSFANASTLSKLGTDANGNLSFDGKTVGKSSNQDTLNKLGTDANGNLLFNGKTLNESSIEVAYNTILSKENIWQASLLLPHDCDTSKSITLALQGIATSQGSDWKVKEKTYPEFDTIVWSGLGLEPIAQEGDSVLVTYYKKI